MWSVILFIIAVLSWVFALGLNVKTDKALLEADCHLYQDIAIAMNRQTGI